MATENTKKVNRKIFESVKISLDKFNRPVLEVAKGYGLSQTTVYRIKKSDSFSEYKGKSTPKPKKESTSRTQAKLDAKKRDYFQCQLYGHPKSGSHSKQLHAHHIIYLSQNGVDEMWNLITLCSHCHEMVHKNKKL